MFGKNGKPGVQIEAERKQEPHPVKCGIFGLPCRKSIRQRARDCLDDADGKQHHTRLQGGVPQDVLQVHGNQKHAAEHSHTEHEHDDIGESEVVFDKEIQPHQRFFR